MKNSEHYKRTIVATE